MTRILIVDDHAVVRRGLMEILAESFPRIEIGEASDAAEALALAAAHEWDAIVLDLNLGDRSGLDVLKEIRSHSSGVPVLILSIHPEDQYARRVLKAGASGYLTKEAAAEELVVAVRKVLGGGTYVSASLAEQLATDLARDTDRPAHETLSDRELEVLCLIAAGKTVSQIAGVLSLSVQTVSTYRARLLEKMSMETNAQLTRYAIEAGLVGL